MKSSTQEWVDKAEADFATASRELRARRQPNHEAYPGETATKEMAKIAVTSCRVLRWQIRHSLGFSE